MPSADETVNTDTRRIEACLKTRPNTQSVADFVAGPGIEKLTLRFDIGELRQALDDCLARESFKGSMQAEGFSALLLTQRPDQVEWTDNDLSGCYWTRADDRYVEEPREDLVPEIEFSEFNPAFRGTYFEYVAAELAKRFPIGRTRVLSKAAYNCNSWHRDQWR